MSQNVYVQNVEVPERGSVFTVTTTKCISAQNGNITGCINQTSKLNEMKWNNLFTLEYQEAVLMLQHNGEHEG
jgi:hypothetical protein